MASFDFAALLEPVSAAEPCGPDLDLAGDPDFANYLARVEGVLPTSFYTRDEDGNLKPFDRATIDFPAEFKPLGKFLAETRDLRLLAIYAKLLLLNRDLPGFAACIGSVASLLTERWDDVNPRGDDGEYGLRSAVLQAFDEMPTVVLPFQNLPIVDNRRTGPISYRTMAVSAGEVPARADETTVDQSDITRALEEVDLDALRTTVGHIRAIRDAVDTIQTLTTEKAGYENSVQFERLPGVVAKLLSVAEPIVASRDPDAAPAAAATEPGQGDMPAGGAGAASGAQAAAVPSGLIASMADAAAALAAASRYFAQFEPSSPGAMLVRQAESLVGKSFMEMIRVLVPARADEARFQIGPDRALQVSLAAMAPPAETTAADEADGWPTDAAASESEEAGTDGEAREAPRAAIEARTRADASSLLQQVATFYRRAEPSSPIPLLIDRARALMDRDFLAILNDVLPKVEES